MLFDYNKLRKEQKEKIMKKWDLFLRGIEDDYLKESTAMLLENEAQYLTEDPSTQASDVAGIQKILLPIVRRVFPNLIANNIVSVQPLAAPTGVIFYLKYQFASTKSGTTALDEYSMYSENPSDTSQGYNPYYSSDEIATTTVALTDGAGGAPSEYHFSTSTSWDNGLKGANWTDVTNPLLRNTKVRFKVHVTATPTTYSTFLIQYDGREGQRLKKLVYVTPL